MTNKPIGLGAIACLSLVGCLPALQVSGRTTSTPATSGATIATTTSPPPAPRSSDDDDRVSGATGQTITIPDVSGKKRAEAEAALRAAGVRGAIDAENNNVDFAIGKVCEQNPGAGQQTRSTLSVRLLYCMPQTKPVDHRTQLIGLDAAEATKRLRAAGFTEKIKIGSADPSADCKVGTVCLVAPDDWEFLTPHLITLYVNQPMTISMPH